VSKGVGLEMVEAQLDARARKVSRRPGNAKPAFMNAPAPVEKQAEVAVNLNDPIEINVGTLPSILSERKNLIQRPIMKTEEIMSRVQPILAAVREKGDVAILDFTEKFDRVKLASTLVLAADFPGDAEGSSLDPDVKSAIDLAFNNIFKFHAAQLDVDHVLTVETMPGVTCSRLTRAISSVGLYIPGGSAVLPSTALMLGVPALVAGCERIVFATPPRSDGSICPEVVYVARKVGAEGILVAGGAQAIAGLAYGTESLEKVDKICGPGNQYVTCAKMVVQVCKEG
jgi:phosphoribosyl-ATP pyrophosphohydrolase/phosphoribosyl-AMP cyclohydrolase/histidinol dehydrogenase